MKVPLSGSRRVATRVFGDRALMVGFLILAVVVICACLAPQIAPFDPLAADPLHRYVRPFAGVHLLGTDELGRDILSRLNLRRPLRPHRRHRADGDRAFPGRSDRAFVGLFRRICRRVGDANIRHDVRLSRHPPGPWVSVRRSVPAWNR